MSGWLYNLGRELGRKAVPAARKGKLIWQGVTGDAQEAWQAEQKLGAEMEAELRQTLEPSSAPSLSNFVSEITSRLAAGTASGPRTFRCELFHESTANAIGLPNGCIFLSDGLVRSCGDRDDELAFVIAHEMAHIIKKHTWDRMISEAALRVASSATSRIGVMGGWLRTQGVQMLRTAHSREREFEADDQAYRLGAAAAFGTEGARTLFQRLEATKQAGLDLGNYFDSHPSPAQRMARLDRRKRLPSG